MVPRAIFDARCHEECLAACRAAKYLLFDWTDRMFPDLVVCPSTYFRGIKESVQNINVSKLSLASVDLPLKKKSVWSASTFFFLNKDVAPFQSLADSLVFDISTFRHWSFFLPSFHRFSSWQSERVSKLSDPSNFQFLDHFLSLEWGWNHISRFHGNLRGPPQCHPPQKQGPIKAKLRETNGFS